MIFREFPCFAQGGYEKECRLLQEPDGISDLEYNLVQNPHRLNSGYALKRFRQMAKQYNRVYKNIFGPEYMEYIDAYINQLTTIKYKGYWHGDIWLENPFRRYFYYAKRVINKKLPKKIRKSPWHNYFPDIDTYHVSISEEQFLEITQDFIDGLCKKVLREDNEYVLLDQLVHPNNLSRYMRYVNNLKVVIVDRDPRDIYIEQMRFKEHTLPTNPYEFCEVYRNSRKMITTDYDHANVLFVRFEDMIYKYDEYTQKVMQFVGVTKEQHMNPRTKFNPAVSIKNTKLWEKFSDYSDAVSVIEKELNEYLYDYEL